MFSGIKSMLFGYSEPNAESASGANNDSKDYANDKSIETSTSSFEQTLNAATTKLTEQLLPQSASIEELQSSSHQILPSLNEQIEQESRRLREREPKDVVAIIDGDLLEANEDDIDEDCFNADSWELLDLVEKPDEAQNAGELELTVQTEDDTYNEKSNSGGILKQGSQKAKNDIGRYKVQRVKPKVSFETPDLVKKELTEIESGIKNEIDSDPINDNGGKNKGKKNKKAASKNNAAISVKDKSTASPSVDEVEDAEIWWSASRKQDQAKTKMQSVVPNMNYAAALAKAKPNNQKNDSSAQTSSVVGPKPGDVTGVTMQTNSSAVKRNRPVSISSCSSSDEIETVEVKEELQIAGAFKTTVNQTIESKASADKVDDAFENIAEDDESVISSGFSDCDYGCGGLNDYVMRPKKAQRRRNNSTSSSKSSCVTSAVNRIGSTRASSNGSKTSSLDVDDSSQTKLTASSVPANASRSGKHLKPRKKKLVVQQSSSGRKQMSTGAPIERRRRISECKDMNEDNEFEEVMEKSTKTGENVADNNCSNESSDIAEMDESWYVTPPPCFTGGLKASKSQQLVNGSGRSASGVTKEAEAERENSLIEHPSIYIASTSKQVLIEKALTDTAANVDAPAVASSRNCKPKKVVLKRKHKTSESIQDTVEEVKQAVKDVKHAIGKIKQTLSDTENISRVNIDVVRPKVNQAQTQGHPLKKSKSVVASSSCNPTQSKRAQKAWENKFVITSWDDDEQDDIGSDFDGFDSPESFGFKKSGAKKSSNKQSKSSFEKKQVRREYLVPLPNDDSNESDDVSVGSAALDGITRYSSDSTDDSSSAGNQGSEVAETNENAPLDEASSSKDDEVASSKVTRGSVPVGRKPPTAVKPIEPERRPGWQLRRMRSKRQPLSTIMMPNSSLAIKSVTSGAQADEPNNKSVGGKVKGKRNKLNAQSSASDNSSGSESNSSSRSTPTLIDRIGSSIVANLSNLTSGLVASTALPPSYALQHNVVGGASSSGSGSSVNDSSSVATGVGSQAAAINGCGGSGGRALVAAMAKTAARGVERRLVIDRKRMSKSYLKRANNCAAYDRQRADRRDRMHRTPNGVSIDRKVHSNFH